MVDFDNDLIPPAKNRKTEAVKPGSDGWIDSVRINTADRGLPKRFCQRHSFFRRTAKGTVSSARKAEKIMRLIYYSLARTTNREYDHQWIQSIRSLRLYNRRISVCFFVFNGVSEAIQREAERWQVMLLPLGDYRDWLRRNHPHGSTLAVCPELQLHKFLVLNEADTTGLSQALYLDCDTFFFNDPEILFESPVPAHWSAREAPTSRLCPHGYDPSNINEELIERIVSFEGLRWVSPFNTGVCLLNNNIWETFGQLRATFFDAAWRLLVGRHCFGDEAAEGGDIRTAVGRTATAYDRDRALPYPSSNHWILDEIALWLTLGHIRNLSQGMLTRDYLIQGDEFVEAIQAGRRPVAAHYFSSNRKKFFHHVSPLGD
jgi:hypothetical protein